MSHDTREKRVWEVIEKTGICMFVTRFSEGLRARPLEARPDADRGVIWFLADARACKDDEIEAHPEVCLTFNFPKQNVYLSLSGRAFAKRDPEQARALWTEKQYAWWPGGPEDENLVVIRFQPSRAEMWDGPASQAKAAYEFSKARLTGEKPNVGEKRKMTLDLD
jgi:general stress protein 26